MKKTIITALAILLVTAYGFSQVKQDAPVRKTEPVNNSGSLNLISPQDGKLFDNSEVSKPVLFRWTAIVPKPKDPVTYRLRVWQLMQGQNGTAAMKSNQPVVTKDVANITQTAISNLYTGPCKPPYLCDFIWAVEALNSNDPNSGKNLGNSGVYSFKIGMERETKTQGDPVHGVDIKLGFETKDQCNPINGFDIQLGIILRNAQGDPVHGVDIKLGVITTRNSKGDPVHGVDIKPGVMVKSINANGDPVHGVDIKLGAVAKANGDPVHGVDIKLGFEGKKEDVDQIQSVDIIATVMVANAHGDPVHGVDIKLGAVAKKANGDPVHGVDVKLGSKNLANGDPVHGVDIKLGATKSLDKELDKNQPNAKSMDVGNVSHPVKLPIDKIIYDASGNIVEIVLRSKDGAPVPKVVVAGSNSISGGAYQPGQPIFDSPSVRCKTVYCHNPLHPPGCGWQECK